MPGPPAIISIAPADVVIPANGEVTMFLNSEDHDRLYYMNAAGAYFQADPSPSEIEKKSLDMAEDVMEGVLCSLKTGVITMTEFNAFVAAGFKVTVVDNGSGTITTTISNNGA